MTSFTSSDTDPSPLISVVMPAYNAMPYIKFAVESVLDQSYPHFELIIVDDASTDATGPYLKTLSDPRIIILTNEKNSGVGATLRRGVEAAKGEIIARFDADDICVRTRFERQLDFLRANPDVGMVGCHYTLIDEDGHHGRRVVTAKSDDALKFRMLFTFPVCHPTIMIRRKIMMDHNLNYDADLGIGEEYKLFTALAEHTKFAVMRDYLLYYRKHSASITKTKPRENVETRYMAVKQYQLQVLGTAVVHDANVKAFTRSYVLEDWPKTGKEVNAFAEGIYQLAKAFLDTHAEMDAKKVYGDAAEMLWRTLLFRSKIIKRPDLMLSLVFQPSGMIVNLPRQFGRILDQLQIKS